MNFPATDIPLELAGGRLATGSCGAAPCTGFISDARYRTSSRLRIDGGGSHWGLGFGIYPEDEQQAVETTFVGHGGACPGYRTSFRLQPDTKFAAIVMMVRSERSLSSSSRTTPSSVCGKTASTPPKYGTANIDVAYNPLVNLAPGKLNELDNQ